VAAEQWASAMGEPAPRAFDLTAEGDHVTVGVARTRAAYEGRHELGSVRELYLDAIAGARELI